VRQNPIILETVFSYDYREINPQQKIAHFLKSCRF
jgi:hypothetical protein